MSAAKKSSRCLAREASLSGWPTATVNDATGSKYQYSSGDHDKPVLKLAGAAELAGRATPAATDCEAQGGPNTPGPTPFLCHVETERRGLRLRLNPAFSLWLMGFPSGWFVTAPAKRAAKRRGESES